ncbi:hypothetical protein [Noviherbaspirillum denitrificans]|uniref:Uncharacterized protein n=1 Tax=Noviherbaspirillum denitrificans TaxID=1968433 RepID=A0A254TA72_9BURK|nr:hypothetical protein [Noviherbaspirillum denitrificans]OWW19465.1 hypothetical protein AYR66_08035 [Noviherbaspirillum denitrificans]
MIDPADSRTLPLQKPTRVHFTTDARIYTVVLDQDLLGDWRLTQSWLTRNGKRGGKSQLVESFAEGMALLEKIAKNRLPETGQMA